MKKFNQMTERQMSQANGGMAIFFLLGGAACTAIAAGVGITSYDSSEKN